jgi:hypothetical protein
MACVIELYREMTEEDDAPTPGTQKQVVDFILADPELCPEASDWARAAEIGEATTNALGARESVSAYACLSAIDETIVTLAPG